MNADDDFGDAGGTFREVGSPAGELEYERTAFATYGRIDDVKYFLQNFYFAIKQGALFDIQSMYETTFPQMSELYFNNISWLDEREVAPLVEHDPTFLILYKELYFRHLHANLYGGPRLKQRVDAFFNYCDFFNMMLSAQSPADLVLPDVWIWELLDEFVYQFQNFAQYRARLNDKNRDDIQILCQDHRNVWSVLCVLNVLHSLSDISQIKQQLQAKVKGQDSQAVAGEFGRLQIYKSLGFFSLIGLLRLHTLLGDYYQAIKVMEIVKIQKKSPFAHIHACHISVAYHVGFSYMMMRRYADAIRNFSEALLYIQRTKQLYSKRSYQNDQINKRLEQMYRLLIMCLVLHPQYIDESIQYVLRDNYHEDVFKMQSGDIDTFRSYFLYSCPRFVSPCPPAVDAPMQDYSRDPLEHQLMVFLDEVNQQKKIPAMRSCLKLYTTLPISKLAKFSEDTSQDDIYSLLMSFKHKMRNLVCTKDSGGLVGTFKSDSDLDFYVDDDMVHTVDTHVSRRYGEIFLAKIKKIKDLNEKLKQIKI